MTEHWLLRVGDGEHFLASRRFRRWGVDSSHTNWVPNFMREVKPGDVLWFVRSGTGGRVIGVATFVRCCARELGPLVSVTPTNEDLGWTKTEGGWDTEVHYTDLYDVTECNILTHIKSPLVGRKFNPSKCAVDLPREYENIVKYSKSFLVR